MEVSAANYWKLHAADFLTLHDYFHNGVDSVRSFGYTLYSVSVNSSLFLVAEILTWIIEHKIGFLHYNP